MLVQEHIGRLQISMDHAMRVSEVDRLGDLNENLQRGLPLHRSVARYAAPHEKP